MNCNAKSFAAFAGGIAAIALLATAAAASFTISRVALTFNDDKPATIVERDGELTVQAEISFQGNGLLRATWEVAGPNPDGSKTKFRILTDIQQPLGGRDAAIVKGPRLPTDSTGTYLVRLRIVKPATALELPVIRYNVIEKKAS